MKKIFLVLLNILFVFALSSCQETPQVGSEQSSKEVVDHTSQKLEVPDRYETVLQQGNVQVTVSADVLVPDLVNLYQYPASYFDFSDQEFQSAAVTTLLGENAVQDSELPEGIAGWKKNEKSLYIEEEKGTFTFDSEKIPDKDVSIDNFVSEELPLNQKEVCERAKEVVNLIGFSDFEPSICEKYGKIHNDSTKEYYLVLLERMIDDVWVKKPLQNRPASEILPPRDSILVAVYQNEVVSLNIRSAQLDKDNRTKVDCISYAEAINIFEKKAISMLIGELSSGEKATVEEVSLSYIYLPKNENKYILTPVWLFLVKLQSNSEKYTYIALDASSGELV